MKTVFSNAGCAHAWAQQNQPMGHSDSMRFEHQSIYSYQTVIARFVNAPSPLYVEPVVLVTSRTYSVTTSGKHMPAVRDAIHGRITFYVDDVLAHNHTHHMQNLNVMCNLYVRRFDKYKRARDNYGYGALHEMASNASVYARAFCLPYPFADGRVESDIRILTAHREEREARLNSPAAIAKREKAHAGRFERMERKAARDRQDEIDRIVLRLRDFRAGEPLRQTFTDEHGYAFLRIAGEEVQTSQGARVPLVNVPDFIRLIMIARDAGGRDFMAGETRRTVDIGAFTLRMVHTNGDVVIGCHDIRWTEIAAIASAMGVTV